MALIKIANLNMDSLVSSDSFLTELQATDSSQVFGGSGSKKSNVKSYGGYGYGGDNDDNDDNGHGYGYGYGYGHGRKGYGGDDD